MPTVKPVSQSADKWVRNAGQAAGDYKRGVASPRRSWATATAAAAEAHAAGIAEAIADKRFERGVVAAGDNKWQRKAVSVGASRFGPGVAAAKADYESGFAPFVGVIESVTLPPRGPAGDPRNYERSQVIGEALHEAKAKGS
jgi:hypothetical protein